MGTNKRCYALCKYMHDAGWTDDPVDRVAPCIESASQQLNAAVMCIRAIASEAECVRSDALRGAATIVNNVVGELDNAALVMRGEWDE